MTSLCHLRAAVHEPELSPHPGSPEARDQMEERRSAGFGKENNLQRQSMLEQVKTKEGENKDKLGQKPQGKWAMCLFCRASLELSALQSMVTVQEEELQVWEEESQVWEEEPQVWEEELQVQAADMEPLTRKIQTKEDLIKDLKNTTGYSEDIPAVECLIQKVLLLWEKFALVESQGQEISGNQRQQDELRLHAWIYGHQVVKPSVVLTPQFLSHDQGQLTKELHHHTKSVPSLMQVPEEDALSQGVEVVPKLHKISSSMIKQGKPQKKEFVQL
ncbi:hypothetical protein P7K49_021194 [Saguinus oedipus]|uniref:Uncharacterized protein n=1 Tax=Saguinus oedipus TaxID=9490 RepID=A0ABQ9USR2_SAGOE|nr:hypothetical protein P7K49_021194 [Saguinus oedipus]